MAITDAPYLGTVPLPKLLTWKRGPGGFDRASLVQVLDYLSDRLFDYFGYSVRLVLYGGAHLVLQQRFVCRKTTDDVNICMRAFMADVAKSGFDAEGSYARGLLLHAIKETARKFDLGEEWMNSQDDSFLPETTDPNGVHIDPICQETMHPSNIVSNTVYQSRGLTLVGIPWVWVVALKLARYSHAKHDPEDIVAILTYEWQGIPRSPQLVEDWLMGTHYCMGYSSHRSHAYRRTRERIVEVTERTSHMLGASSSEELVPMPPVASSLQRQRPSGEMFMTMHDTCMYSVLQYMLSNAVGQSLKDSIDACIQSGAPFELCVHSSLPDAAQGNFADAVLCTMQEILDTHSAYAESTEKDLMRRTMMKFSQKTQAIPSAIFLKGVQCTETEPRGMGGYADVFKGSATGHGAVALKRLRVFEVSGVKAVWNSICREALLWRQLRHPSILPFLGLDKSTFNAFCMVSPWLNNGNVGKYLREHRNINMEWRSKWISQVADGMYYLHKEQVVHGDLRGANILLDDKFHVRLADFGLSKFTDAGASTMGINTWHEGAVRWTAPELLSAVSACKPSGDVYSFGCVCLEIVTGNAPFPELQKDMQVIARVCAHKSRPQWPSSSSEETMAAEIGSLATRCWDSEPSNRPTMQKLKGKLEKLRRKHYAPPTPAAPPSPILFKP